MSNSSEEPSEHSWVGLVVLIAGVLLIVHAGYSFWVADPAGGRSERMLHWWEELPLGGLGTFLGALLSGLNKPRSQRKGW